MTNECEISCSKFIQQKYGPKAIVAQSLAVIAQSLLFLEFGMNLAIPTIVLREVYHQSNGELLISITEASWYGSLLYLVQPVASILSGIAQVRFGKKCCMFFSNVPDLAGWILLYYARGPLVLCASSTLKGISAGFGSGSTSSYVGEITEPRLRGSLGSLGCMAIAMGTLLIYVLGSFFEWRTIALLSTVCPLTCMCLVIFIPESPIWLVAKGEYEKAERAICWLRGWVKPEIIKEEFLEIIRYDKMSGTLRGKIDNDDEGLFAKLAQFMDPTVYRPMRLMLISFSMAFMSGIFPARPFMTDIMTEVELFDNQNELLVLFAVLICLGSSISTAIIHRSGKRFLILSTLSINAILLLLFGAYVIAIKNNYIGPLHWIPLTILCSIFFFGSCGISYISWTLLIEVFPNKSRGIATSTCTGLTSLLFFTSTKIYLSIEITLGLGYTMILFGFLSFLGLTYLYVYLPETENKTLLEIEEFFASNSKGYRHK